eukprot:CAMPEP_0182437692 /NCGR_PEP_ID=MMETSP1167-20130531/85222_1 /TAXON_ID=2988 /ORGANISM="Mallomonas Sp, Strain CCMP3275" /LENGTH=794 /DNA_ID=CAMNT_0024630707 /DNA_START=25 /DNA_END=2409 /DNA_ORIENTATION=-
MTSRGGPPQVKNRAPAPIQITAEQLLREAKDRGLEDVPRAPKQYITDKEELQLYRQNKRKDFEDQVRRQRHHMGTWMKYGLWEASQKEFERSRSVFERAIDVDYRNQSLWLKYAEMEMKNKFINHARNIWDRAVTLHPRVDMFWYKYSYMEEMIGAIENARQIFERWMKWEPDDMGWSSYIKFEMRQSEIPRARAIYERYITCHPTCKAYLKYAKWEEAQYQKALSRQVYERAIEELHPQEKSEKLLINFARFEERCKEYDRARVIFKFALTQQSTDIIPELYSEYISFEKRHGTRERIEEAIVSKRREQYELKIQEDKYDYDTWFDYCRLEQDEGNKEKIRNIYNQALQHSPPILEKKYWRRYIYLWIYYAVWEELVAKERERAREIYKRCLNVIPHKKFTFGKIWIYAAELEVREKDLGSARRIFGTSIGMCPKESLFKAYISLELQLGEVDRCRAVYSKYLEHMSYCCEAWCNYAKLEINVGEIIRARSVYELAVSQSELDMPEVLWKAYIDFEISQTLSNLRELQEEREREEEEEREREREMEVYRDGVSRVRRLYERLLEKSTHVKVWISYGQFEAFWLPADEREREKERGEEESEREREVKCPESEEEIIKNMREIYKRGYDTLRDQGLKEERVLLLQSWRESEMRAGKYGCPSDVESRMPRKVKMKRVITAEERERETGEREGGMEEYYDYSFPDDEKPIVGIKILENAMKWKMMMAQTKNTEKEREREKEEEGDGKEERENERDVEEEEDVEDDREKEEEKEDERERERGESRKRKAEEELDIDDV